MRAVFKKALLTCFAVYAVIALFILLQNGSDTIAMIGLAGLLLGLVFFGIGVIGCIPTKTRPMGQAFLLCSGIIFLVGVSVCSVFQSHMNFH